jgi:hypothetical protein
LDYRQVTECKAFKINKLQTPKNKTDAIGIRFVSPQNRDLQMSTAACGMPYLKSIPI